MNIFTCTVGIRFSENKTYYVKALFTVLSSVRNCGITQTIYTYTYIIYFCTVYSLVTQRKYHLRFL